MIHNNKPQTPPPVMLNPFKDEDEDELRETAKELNQTDWGKPTAEYIATCLPPDAEHWEIIPLTIKKLHDENHLTQQQATRLRDQIQQVLNYVHTIHTPADERHNNISIRINGLEAKIDLDTGAIDLYTREKTIKIHAKTLDEHYITLRTEDNTYSPIPRFGLPNVNQIKPAYYKKTNSSILTEKLGDTARKIENTDQNHPLWVRYAVDLHRYVKYIIKTKPSTPSPQKVQKPRDTIDYQSGDIGSKATLLASLYEAVGIICSIVITHSPKNNAWRPILLIKGPEDIHWSILSEKIAEYYTKDTATDPDDLLPLLYTSSKLRMQDKWLIADPEAQGIGQPYLSKQSNSNTSITQFITSHLTKDVPIEPDSIQKQDNPVSLQWVEEHQYINL